MRNDTSATPETELDSTHPRRGARRRRTNRKRLIIAGAIAATGLLVGTGFTVQSAISTQASIDATTALTESTGVQHEQLGAYATIAAERTRANAEDTITAANATLAAVDGKVDASSLASSVASLGEYKTLPIDDVVDLAAQTRAEAEKARIAAAEYDRVQAEKAKAAAEALARAEHARRRQGDRPRDRRVEVRLGRGRVPVPRPLWQKESGWSYTAMNASSGATGIPQALPGSKMATAGSDWQTNAATQVAWGLDYIQRGYGSPCGAWSHSQAVNWY